MCIRDSTRSMAEILAEQGDLRGAIDIYEELAGAALPEDLPAIYRRLDSLRAALGLSLIHIWDSGNQHAEMDMVARRKAGDAGSPHGLPRLYLVPRLDPEFTEMGVQSHESQDVYKRQVWGYPE